MLKAIIFDIDGVITNLSFFHFIAWKSVFSFHDIVLNNDEWENYRGLPRLATAKKIVEHHHKSMSDDKILSIANKKNDLFVHLIKYGLTPKDVMNGIKQLIDDAITRGLQLIAISSSANAVLEMKCLGLFDKFTYVSSYSTKRTSNFDKGQQSPLLQSLKKLNINPSECIGLEDDVEGIIEYKSANVFAVAIANYHESIKTEADYWVELPEQIVLEEIIFNYYKKDTSND